MRKLIFTLALGVAATTGGCSKSGDSTAEAKGNDKAELPTMTVDEVDTQVAAKQVQAVDCNHPKMRKNMGIVPGAIQISDVDAFAATELPADKTAKLVFYCADPG